MDNTHAPAMTFTNYRLPDGRIVPGDATAAKGALVIGFELKAVPPARRGRVVEAVRHDEPRLVHRCAWHQPSERPPAGVVYSHTICDACMAHLAPKES